MLMGAPARHQKHPGRSLPVFASPCDFRPKTCGAQTWPQVTRTVQGWNQGNWQAAINEAGYPKAADTAKYTWVNWFMTELVLVIMLMYVTMVYGPIAAFLVEMFPTKIRYTSMSLPYHIG